VDSPIILGLVYKDRYSEQPEYPAMFYDETFDQFVLSLFKKYDSLNILLKRNDSTYNEKGRFQDLEEAKEIDDDIENKLISYNIPYITFDVNDFTHYDIFNYILKNNI
jgi:hypothetical protein